MTTFLTADTPIPRDRRTLLRHVLRKKPGFTEQLLGLFTPRDVPNRVFLMFALDNGYADLVEDILTAPPEQLIKTVHHRRKPS
jgi:hypothetical protein